MKRIKRIIAVIILVAVAAMIGYLVYTSNQLSAINASEGVSVLESVICVK